MPLVARHLQLWHTKVKKVFPLVHMVCNTLVDYVCSCWKHLFELCQSHPNLDGEITVLMMCLSDGNQPYDVLSGAHRGVMRVPESPCTCPLLFPTSTQDVTCACVYLCQRGKQRVRTLTWDQQEEESSHLWI